MIFHTDIKTQTLQHKRVNAITVATLITYELSLQHVQYLKNVQPNQYPL